ncbi:MAG: NUDIX domain-containing protein, partial [Clostridia bacterium]|nr:NUDIX domain-containing protein [Clostridia bacterium]
MEKWDILNSNGEKTCKTAVRGRTILSAGEYHLVVHIWIMSNDGKFLIQRRSRFKKLMPGEWAATGGAAISGEDSFTAASRELKEELGISSNKDTLKFVKRIKRRNSFVDVWMMVADIPDNQIKLQKSEVEKVQWVTKDALK